MAPEWQKQPFFQELLSALWHGDEDAERNGTYAAGGSIAPAPHQGSLLESIEVEGVGAIQLPLSAQDVPKLVNVCQQAPYGHGLATVVDTNVRRAWQVDASKVTFPSMPGFVTKTVQAISNKAVHALGLHGAAPQVEGHLYKLLLYEAGGHFSRHRDTEKETGMFGTLVLQLPTQEGFEGGSLVVHHSGQTKTYDFSKDSSTRFFYTAFFADCEHELQKITSGTRLCLAFNLVRANDSLDMSLGELKGYSSRLAKVEATLRPWLEAATAEELQGELDRKLPSKLAIPLQHKYTMKTFSFAGLKGDDRLVAQVLQSCRDRSNGKSLELHLCILTKHQIGDPHTFDLKYRRRYYDRDDGEEAVHTHRIGEIYGEYVQSVKWVGTSNKVCSFAIHIDEAKEVVLYQDEGPFGHDAKPDEVEYEGNFGNEGLTMEYWYHKAMLVMWPRTKTFSLACKLGFSAVLDILESRLAEKGSDFSTLLHQALAYCKCNSGLLSQFPERLLQLCVVGGALEDVLCILRLLSDPLQDEGQTASDPAISTLVGINNANSVAAIAEAVKKHGWEQCGADVMELLKQPHVTVQGKHFGQLALMLKKSGSFDAALLVAKRTLDLAFSAGSSLGDLEKELVRVMAKLIFSFKECLEDLGLTFVNRLVEVNTHILCSLVIQVYTLLSNNKHIIRQEFCREDDVNGASLFIRLCEIVTSRDFHHPKESSHYVVDLVQIFHFLGIEQLFDKLIQAFVDQSRHYGRQYYLHIILLDADIIWEKLSGSTMGQRGLQSLAEAFIEQVAAKEKPVFNWCMPLAKFPGHPAVEEFLRGPQSSLVYTGVNSLNDARIFARKYFSGRYQKNGYSATAEDGGKGASAYCKITKTRAVFEKLLLLWEKEQQEIVPLKARMRILQTTTAQVPGEVVVLFPDSSLHHDEEQKIETTEYIDLKLDD